MKKILTAALVLSLALTGVVFGQVKAKDGVYFAQEDKFGTTGWADQVVLTVVAGKITAAEWNGVSNLGGADKQTVAATGGYGMIKASKLKLEWDVQAKNTAAYLVKTQDIAGKFKADGTADGIAGASLHVNGFFALVNKALATAPVTKGPFKKSGWFTAEQADFDAKTGWKDNVLVTVVNGTVVGVVWNGLSKDAKLKSKLVTSEAGKYGMEKSAKLGAWHLQAAKVEEAIVKAGDPAKIALKADGTTDAIAGASLHPTAVSLAVEALKAAR